MKRLAISELAIFLAACMMPVGVPRIAVARAAAGGGCATSAAKIADTPKITLPEGAKISSKSVVFEIDVGSDGRVRGVQMDRSSGDAGADLAFRQALQAASYEPPQTGCVAYSGGILLTYPLGPEVPGSLAAAPPVPVSLSSTCTPFVLAFLTPGARDRKRTGTAVVDVELDASATRAGTPALRKTTGSPILDREAIRIASTGHYNFLHGSSCTPQPFTYSLELTFQ